MYQKKMGMPLILALLMILMTGLTAASAEAERAYEDERMGIRFTIPVPWIEAMAGESNVRLQPLNGRDFGFSLELLPSEAVVLLDALYKQIEGLSQADIPKEILDQFDAVLEMGILVCAIDAVKDGKNPIRALEQLPDKKPLAEVKGTTYTLYYNQNRDVSALPEADRATYEALVAGIADMEKSLEMTGIKGPEELTGKITFESETLTGEAIDSGVFADYRLTAVNIWTTWCGPCVQEMPDLQKLYHALPEGINLIGICADGADDPESAALVLQSTGVKYPNVVANNAMIGGFLQHVIMYPTTLFVDSQGNIVGKQSLGAPSGDVVKEYLRAIEDRLAILAK